MIITQPVGPLSTKLPTLTAAQHASLIAAVSVTK